MRSGVSKATALRTFASLCVFTCWCSTAAAGGVVFEMDLPRQGAVETAASYVVQAKDVEAAARAVESVGGKVIGVSDIDHAVQATLLPIQVELLKRRSEVRSVLDVTKVTTSSNATEENSARSSSDKRG